MGVAAIFASLSTPIFSMLQAVGRVDLPVKLLCVGLGLKIGLNYVLTGIPEINILGAGIGTLVCYVFITISACYFLWQRNKNTLEISLYFYKTGHCFHVLLHSGIFFLLCYVKDYAGLSCYGNCSVYRGFHLYCVSVMFKSFMQRRCINVAKRSKTCKNT